MKELLGRIGETLSKEASLFGRSRRGSLPKARHIPYLTTSFSEQYSFWKLDASEKCVIMTETDVDPYVDGVSHIGKVRKGQ